MPDRNRAAVLPVVASNLKQEYREGRERMKVWLGRAVLAMMAVCAPALTGCAGFFVPATGGSGSTTGDYVYVANANPSVASIAAYSLSSTGSLTALSGSPYSLTFIPTAVAVTPKNGYLYVGGTTGLYVYTIGSTGALTLVGSAGASIPVASIAITPDGDYLYALQSNVIIGSNVTPTQYSVTLDEYQIGSSGALTLAGTVAYTTTSGTFTPRMVQIAPNGDLAALALGSAGTAVYPLASDLTGTTVNILGEANLSSDNALSFDSNSSYLYIARSGTTTGLAGYTVSSTGGLQQVGTTLGTTGSQPSAVALNSTGKYGYVGNYGSGTISGFSITAGSVPAVLSSSPYAAGTEPVGLVADNSGSYVLTVNSGGSPDLQVWSVNSTTGALTLASSSATGTDPTLPIAIAATH